MRCFIGIPFSMNGFNKIVKFNRHFVLWCAKLCLNNQESTRQQKIKSMTALRQQASRHRQAQPSYCALDGDNKLSCNLPQHSKQQLSLQLGSGLDHKQTLVTNSLASPVQHWRGVTTCWTGLGSKQQDKIINADDCSQRECSSQKATFNDKSRVGPKFR